MLDEEYKSWRVFSLLETSVLDRDVRLRIFLRNSALFVVWEAVVSCVVAPNIT
jgi:hypothetical protein